MIRLSHGVELAGKTVGGGAGGCQLDLGLCQRGGNLSAVPDGGLRYRPGTGGDILLGQQLLAGLGLPGGRLGLGQGTAALSGVPQNLVGGGNVEGGGGEAADLQ